jgi:Ca2+-binding RTX toxin-like protein
MAIFNNATMGNDVRNGPSFESNQFIGFGDGSDMLTGGALSDVFFLTADANTDVINGGFGPASDRIDYSGSNRGLTIALDNGTVTSTFRYETKTVATLTSIEDAVGSSHDDSITGSSVANVLDGGAGNDKLYGLAGNDTLIGGAGDDILDGGRNDDTLVGGAGMDTLIGGAGGDDLTGGTGADMFYFGNISDMPDDVFTNDRITDFERGIDHIDLSNIDANVKAAGNQSFVIVDQFTHTAGELMAVSSGGPGFNGQCWLMDVDGDGLSDARIYVDSAPFLTSSDFIL